jgi:hypothetical protein
MLSHLDGQPESYRRFAIERYDVQLPVEAIAEVYRHAELTDDLIARLNPRATLGDLGADAAEIGYPER